MEADPEPIPVGDPDGETSYIITRVHNPVVPEGAHPELFVNVEIKGPVSYRQYCDIGEMADDPQKAPLSHFHGPLTVEVRKINFEIYAALALKRADNPTNIFSIVV